MLRYKIFETETFKKELNKTASPYEQTLIRKKLEKTIYPQLRDEPHYGGQVKKLKGFEPETWRYRIGNFRVFYSIDKTEKTVVITSVRLRKDAYR